MKSLKTPTCRAPFRALFTLAAAAAATSVLAETNVFSFDADHYLPSGSSAGDVELGRPQKPANGARSAVYPLEPAAPRFNYGGPPFLLGYEVRASAPSNLTVSPDKAVVEDDFKNGETQKNDTITITAISDWPLENTYSVAAAIVFPTAEFDLTSLSYSALNWTKNKTYNEVLRHRWIVQSGGRYYVNTSFLGRTANPKDSPSSPVEIMSAYRHAKNFDYWVAYDPAKSLFVDFDAPQVQLGEALGSVTAVGLYMDALNFKGTGQNERQWQIRLIKLEAGGSVRLVAGGAKRP